VNSKEDDLGLCDGVRRDCAEIAVTARSVAIDVDGEARLVAGLADLAARPEPALDPERHYLEGSREDVTAYLLALDAINFGSGWFPALRKRPGCSGYFTVAWALADHWRAEGPWDGERLRRLDAATVATVLGQEADHEPMALYAEALNDLGEWLGGRSAVEAIGAAGGSAQRLAEQLAAGMPFFDDRGFYKRAQIVPADLALAGVAEFEDLGRLTIFADNLVPHVLRVEGVLRYDDALARQIDTEALLEPGVAEREIRACAVHVCERLARAVGVAPRVLDTVLWNRGQEPRFKALPRHRTRTVFY
jgi:hypothetical protein